MEKINKIHKKNTKIVDTYLTGMPFKGATLCHEDIEAVLGQFCSEVITQCLYPYTKCSYKVTKKISNKFHQEAL